MRVRTHGKVNLFLRVLGRRGDGFHEVETILHGISLADDVTIVPSGAENVEIDLQFEEGLVGVAPPEEENLVAKAAESLAARGIGNTGFRAEILKRIPIGAGLGGGSADAAAALVVMNEISGGALGRKELAAVAAEIGSDVPYFLDGGTALATGRGEKVTQLVAPESLWLVLGMSWDPLATGAVYAAWDDLETPPRGDATPRPALGAGSPEEIAALLHNDLEAAAFSLRPGLEEKKQAMLDAGALGALVSGSGPTLFAPCRNHREAEAVAEQVRKDFDRVAVVTSRTPSIRRL